MATALTVENVRDITDRLGKINQRRLAIAASSAGTDVTTGGANMVTEVLDLTDIAAVVKYASVAQTLRDATAAPYLPLSDLTAFLRTLHGDLGGWDTYAEDEGIQYSEGFRDLVAAAAVGSLSAKYVFKEASVDPMGSFAVTGSGAGTYTDGAAIDSTLYGGARIEGRTTSLIGAAGITATVSVTYFDTTTGTKTLTIPATTADATTIAIGSAADRVVNVTGITITGGTSGDAFKVRSVVPRTPGL